MADRTYYGLIDFETGFLKRVTEKPSNLPGSGVIQADLDRAMQRARVWIFQKLLKKAGLARAQALDTAWVAEAASYPAAVPQDIRELAKVVAASFVWEEIETFHGRERQQDNRKKQSRKLVSVSLMEEAVRRWDEIAAVGVLVYDNMTVADLTTSGQGYSIGIAAPSTTTFFPDSDQSKVHGALPSFSAERVFKDLEGDFEP